MSWVVTQADDCQICMTQNKNANLDTVRTINFIVTMIFFKYLFYLKSLSGLYEV